MVSCARKCSVIHQIVRNLRRNAIIVMRRNLIVRRATVA
jgi:hypothetical protein